MRLDSSYRYVAHLGVHRSNVACGNFHIIGDMSDAWYQDQRESAASPDFLDTPLPTLTKHHHRAGPSACIQHLSSSALVRGIMTDPRSFGAMFRSATTLYFLATYENTRHRQWGFPTPQGSFVPFSEHFDALQSQHDIQGAVLQCPGVQHVFARIPILHVDPDSSQVRYLSAHQPDADPHDCERVLATLVSLEDQFQLRPSSCFDHNPFRDVRGRVWDHFSRQERV